MSTDRSHRAWLASELPQLVRDGVLDADAAERLRTRYALEALGDARSTRKLILALLGALLVGAGVLLLFAHNWDALSRPVRAAISLSQLALAQALGFYAVTRRASSVAWREATAALIALSVGAAIGLVSQTYHLEGELGDFMLWWLALALPLTYVLPARIVATLVALGSPVLAMGRDYAPDHGLVYYAFLVALLPALELRKPASAIGGLTALSRWAIALSVPLAGSALVIERSGAPWLPFYAALAGVFIALGCLLERDAPHAAQRPFSTIGGLGMTLLLLVLSYDESWRDWRIAFASWQPDWLTPVAYGAAVLLGAVLAVLAPLLLRTRDATAIMLASCALAALALYALGHAGVTGSTLAALSNVVMLGLGALLLAFGLRGATASVANRGLGVLSVLFVARFFDSDLSFVLRGIGFVVLGLTFLAVNGWLARKHKEAA